MADNIQQIKDRLDVVDVLSGYIKVQKSGVNFKARCPFHNEKTPSFYISPERQIWHCFGCSKGGDIFGFIKEIEGVEFPEALRILAAKAGIELEPFKAEEKDSKSVLYEVVEISAKFFEKQLYNSNTGKKALTYLKNRGLTEETIKQFRLGFAPNDWSSLSKFLTDRGYLNSDIIGSGLAIKRENGDGIYDRFRSRIVFPIFDLNDQVVGFSGRIFGEESNEETAKYINTPQTVIYDKSRVLYGLNKSRLEVKKANQCVLVEGNADVLMSYQGGVKNVVASSGTALTQNHLRLLSRYTNSLGFCFDTDQAGAIATRRGIGLALSQNFNVKVVEIDDKDCKDPADYVQKHGPAWAGRVEKAKPVLDFYFDKVKKDFDPASAESKKLVIAVLAPFVKRLASQVERGHWIGKLALLLRAKENDIEADMVLAKDDLEVYDRGESVPAGAVTKLVIAEPESMGILNEALLSVVIKNPALFKEDLKNINKKVIHPDLAELIADLVKADLDNFKFDKFVKKYDEAKAMKMEFAHLRSQELWQDFKEEDLKTEFFNLLEKIRVKSINARLAGLEIDIRQAETAGDKKQMADLLNKFTNLTKELTETKSV